MLASVRAILEAPLLVRLRMMVTPFIHHSSAGQSDSCRMLMLSMRATDHASSVKLFLFGRSFLANSESLMIIGQSRLRAPLGFSDLQKT